MNENERTELKAALALLRHAFMHLDANTVIDQRRLARGLLSPAIKRVENSLREPT